MDSQLEPAPQATENQRVILLVEDDDNDALLARRALARAGVLHRIIHLIDGEEAVKYLSGEPPYQDRVANPIPALVLLDLKMPKITGLDVLTWLQTRPDLASLPVVVLTGSIQERDRTNAQKLGAVGYEVKPVDFSALLNIVQNIGTRWLKQPPEHGGKDPKTNIQDPEKLQ
jgi:CheY-like chemotaxis protein